MASQMDRTQMKEVPAPMIVKPFGKVHYWDMPDGSGRIVRAFILGESQIEGAKTGLAIDYSAICANPYLEVLRVVDYCCLLRAYHSPPNHVRPAAQAISDCLARGSADHKVAVIYWATGPGGKDIQMLGDLALWEVEKFDFDPPDHYGKGRQLLPALKYFTDGQQRKDLYTAPWGRYVFITSGPIEDMDAVKRYCTQLTKDIDAGRRNGLKLFIIGLGNQADKDQLDKVADLETGTDVDLWDTGLVSGIIDEVVILIPGDGIIRDGVGNVVVDCRDPGLPDVLEFTLPPGAKSFSLEVAGRTVTQPLP